MLRVLLILWNGLFIIAGWYLYRHPVLFENTRHERWQIRFNKILGMLLMVGGGFVAVAYVLFSFVRM